MPLPRLTVACAVTISGLLLASPHAQQAPEVTVSGMKTEPGLAVTLWAAEPQLSNATNMAIDERGRVWVLEGVNYRRQLRNQPDIRPAGDRILILEDTDNDGRADKVTVFDQSPDIRTPLGIAVLGDKVFVSQSPNITVYTKDARDRIVSKEVFLTGFKGADHDHGVHALVFGPDGRYYFDTGNEGWDITDRSGTRVRMDATSYFQGAAFRVNPDGTGLAVLAHNFRNPYELALDSFGTIFQSDNDDDGNAWTRLNYLMEGGNYGFRGPLNRTWREDRGTHFHAELPGVVPNIARLGAGAPCGLAVYEGTLLPEKYRGQLLHAEAGKRIIAAYLQSDEGAGYSTRAESLVTAADTWFRPSDVTVAPDGSVFIADWYDPGVGGHGMGDPQGARGRIYRLAPTAARPTVPRLDLETPAGLTAALRSPNQDVFYLAHSRLTWQGHSALPLLRALWQGPDPVLRARALWLAGAIGPDGAAMVREALRDQDARFRVLGLRVLARNGADVVAAAQPLLHDPAPQVRREILLNLRDPRFMTPPYLVGDQAPAAPAVMDTWVALAKQYDAKDRWYLEALGIAARGREEAIYARLRAQRDGITPGVFNQLLVELRPKTALPDLVAVANDGAADVPRRLQALDALGSMQWPEAAHAVEALTVADGTPRPLVERGFRHYSHQLFSMWPDARTSAALPAIMRIAFGIDTLQIAAVETADALGDPQFAPDLLALARSESAAPDTRAAAVEVVGRGRNPEHMAALEALAATGPLPVRLAAVRARGFLGGAGANTWARGLVLGGAPNELRFEALRVLARTPEGLTMILDMADERRLPAELTSLATSLVNGAPGAQRGAGGGISGFAGGRGGPASDPTVMAAIRARAATVLPVRTGSGPGAVPGMRTLERDFQGDAAAGRRVFENEAACATCHSVGGQKKLGPDLSAIGEKFGKQALLDAILNPSEAIAPEYQVWVLATKDRGDVSGLIASDTSDAVIVNVSATEQIRLKPSDIVSRRPYRASIMPEGLLSNLTSQQIADLLEYLATLKKR
jgi:putative membrane-bound dehydrogenase-like protein